MTKKTKRILWAAFFIVGLMLRGSDLLDMQHERFHQGLATSAGIRSEIIDRSNIVFYGYDRNSVVGAYWLEFITYGMATVAGTIFFYPIGAVFLAIDTVVYCAAPTSLDFNRNVREYESRAWMEGHKQRWLIINGILLLMMYGFAIGRVVHGGKD